MTYNLSLFRMPKAWGHAFPEGGMCDNYSNSGNKYYLLMSRCVLKLSAQVLKYSRAKLKHNY